MSEANSPFHRGETAIQTRLGIVQEMEDKGRRVIRDRIPEDKLGFFDPLSFLAIATADECGRPWASILAGEPGFARATDPRTLELRGPSTGIRSTKR